MTRYQRLRRIRAWLAIVVFGLVVSGVTAFALELEIRYLLRALRPLADEAPALVGWVARISEGLSVTAERYPFLAYGTDWLGFAHLMIAVAFWGAMKDPVRNVWVVQFGMLCCSGIVPLALICGRLRGIPFGWTCLDISFAALAMVPLILAYRHIRVLAA